MIRTSQLQLCDGNHCAAALLSFFEYWHNIKLEHQAQAAHANRIAQQHGEDGKQDISLFQYHNENGLEKGLLGLYGRKTIRAALEILVRKGFVTIHANPNPRYRFDKTHYYLFHPEHVSSQLIDITDEVKVLCRCESGKNDAEDSFDPILTQDDSQLIDITDEVKIPHREGDFTASSGKNAASSGKNAATRTEITPEITSRDLNPSPLTPQRGKRERRARFAPEDFTVTLEMRTWAQTETPGIDIDFETARFKDYEFQVGKTDWRKAWHNWIRKAWHDAPNRPHGKTTTTQAIANFVQGGKR